MVEGRMGRPRSERARESVLHAVDDLVAEVGYGAVTFSAIAERAGVSRQTVYRWWSTKAEILLEATVVDAQEELVTDQAADPVTDLANYLEAVIAFLTRSAAGAAYRALVGEAQHDAAVARLLTDHDVLGDSAAAVLERSLPAAGWATPDATAGLIGPVFFWVLSGRPAEALDPRALAREFLDRSRP